MWERRKGAGPGHRGSTWGVDTFSASRGCSALSIISCADDGGTSSSPRPVYITLHYITQPTVVVISTPSRIGSTSSQNSSHSCRNFCGVNARTAAARLSSNSRGLAMKRARVSSHRCCCCRCCCRCFRCRHRRPALSLLPWKPEMFWLSSVAPLPRHRAVAAGADSENARTMSCRLGMLPQERNSRDRAREPVTLERARDRMMLVATCRCPSWESRGTTIVAGRRDVGTESVKGGSKGRGRGRAKGQKLRAFVIGTGRGRGMKAALNPGRADRLGAVLASDVNREQLRTANSTRRDDSQAQLTPSKALRSLGLPAVHLPERHEQKRHYKNTSATGAESKRKASGKQAVKQQQQQGEEPQGKSKRFSACRTSPSLTLTLVAFLQRNGLSWHLPAHNENGGEKIGGKNKKKKIREPTGFGRRTLLTMVFLTC